MKDNAMKKMYVKPTMEVVEIHSDVAMLAGSNPESNVGFGGGDGGGNVEAESNGRRGGWGNLWE